MTPRRRSATRLHSTRLVAVLICLWAFVTLPIPQSTVPASAETSEAEYPCQEDREISEEELVVCSSARRRLNIRRHRVLGPRHESSDRFHQITSYAQRFPALVGHQLRNGICAPLLN